MANNRLAFQPAWIEAGTDDFNVTTLAFPGALGAVWTKDGKTYQIVKTHASTSAIAIGTPVGWQDFDDFVVTAEADDINRNLPAGVALDTVTAGNYCVIQVAGPHTAIICANGSDAVAKDSLILGTTDGSVIRVAAGTASTYLPLAIATATCSANAIAGVIVAPHNSW